MCWRIFSCTMNMAMNELTAVLVAANVRKALIDLTVSNCADTLPHSLLIFSVCHDTRVM